MQKGQLQIRKQGYLREDLYDEDSGKPIKFTSWVGGKMEEDKKRLDYMDIAKGFGIICVIVGHMGYRALDRVIFSFHMPLFFLISGYFLDEKRSSKEGLIKRSRQLLPPYIFTCVCIVSLIALKDLLVVLIRHENVSVLFYDLGKWLYASFYGAGTSHDRPFSVVQIGPIWFLLAMIIGTYIVQTARKTKCPLMWVMITALIGYFTSKIIWLPWSVQAAMTAAVFIYFGVVLKKYNAFEENCAKVIFPVTLVLLIGEIIYGDPHLSIARNYYPNGVFDFIGGGGGAICIIIIVKYLSEHLKFRKVWSAFKWLGKNSLIILCLHQIEMIFVPYQKLFNIIGIREHLFWPIQILKFLLICTGTFVVQHTVFRKIFDRGGVKRKGTVDQICEKI